MIGGAALAALLMARKSGAMGRGEVPAEKMHYESKEAYLRAIYDAYLETDLPTGEPTLLATTHSAFATGTWYPDGPRVFNNNIGVIRSTRNWDGAYARMSTYEVIDGQRVLQRGQAFRAYDSLADSARDAVRLWKTSRYISAYRMLASGNPAWSGELGRRGYYTADPVTFERGYRNRLGRVRAVIERGERLR